MYPARWLSRHSLLVVHVFFLYFVFFLYAVNFQRLTIALAMRRRLELGGNQTLAG